MGQNDELGWTRKLGDKAVTDAGQATYFALFDILYFFGIRDPLQARNYRHDVLAIRKGS